ncbi:MAG: hypothetical protein QOC87_126 [Actinomycetota bacterium]|nr:hypothetical protein [Actinomycetota bacterium]
MLQRLRAWLQGRSRRSGAEHTAPIEPPPPPPEKSAPKAPGTPKAPVKTMPPGTVTLIHDDGTVSSLPDPEQSSITYVVDELLAAQGTGEQGEKGSREH